MAAMVVHTGEPQVLVPGGEATAMAQQGTPSAQQAPGGGGGAADVERASDQVTVAAGHRTEERQRSSASSRRDSTAQADCTLRTARRLRLLAKVVGVGLMLLVLLMALVYWPRVLIDDDVAHRKVMSAIFMTGLFLVAVEDYVGINKSAVMLILAGAMWVFTAVGFHPKDSEEGYSELHEQLAKGLEDVGSIILFLLPAMGLVESIDHFGGFRVVTQGIERLVCRRQDRLMPIICLLSFFMSSVIDNLTATIVAIKLLRHTVPNDDEWRRLCGGLAVVAANAGGAWSPIGDVTTTMLWIQGKISALETVVSLFLPSFVAGVVPLGGIWWQARRHLASKSQASAASTDDGNLGEGSHGSEPSKVTMSNVGVLALGIACILMVPVLKIWTGLPPYLGMLLALGIVWVATDSMGIVPDSHAAEGAGAGHFATAGGAGGPAAELDIEAVTPADPSEVSSDSADGQKPPQQPLHAGAMEGGVPEALHKVDLTGLLFFTGVLLAVVALDSAGVLQHYANFLAELCDGSNVAISALLGVSSAVVDNVPLVEAAIEMFHEVPLDDPLWQLVALAAGTGGSILSVGSIAGVTLMGMEGVGFLWYCRRVSLWAAVGFAAAIGTYQLQYALRALAQGS